jgi:hypothetical protein
MANDIQKPNPPQFAAFHVTEAKEGEKARWRRIGAYFAHVDGEGGTLILDLLPLQFDGRIVLRTPKTDQA